jgi:nucleoside-diphosphate-sugar epimerase
MRIAVTGSTSVIGQRLLSRLIVSGHTPIALGRKELIVWHIGQELPKNLDFDLLIHLAHDRSLSLKQNVEAAKILCSSFRGPKLFLSSFSAHSKSLSKYGKSKYEIENVFSQENGISLRAGVVYGDQVGGIFAQLVFLIKSSPVIPIPFRGSPMLFTSHIDDLIEEIILSLEQIDGFTTFAAHPMPITLNSLCLQIQNSLGTRKQMIKVGRQPLEIFLRFLSYFFPNFPMADSLLSLSREASYEELSKLKAAQSNFRSFRIDSE